MAKSPRGNAIVDQDLLAANSRLGGIAQDALSILVSDSLKIVAKEEHQVEVNTAYHRLQAHEKAARLVEMMIEEQEDEEAEESIRHAIAEQHPEHRYAEQPLDQHYWDTLTEYYATYSEEMAEIYRRFDDDFNQTLDQHFSHLSSDQKTRVKDKVKQTIATACQQAIQNQSPQATPTGLAQAAVQAPVARGQVVTTAPTPLPPAPPAYLPVEVPMESMAPEQKYDLFNNVFENTAHHLGTKVEPDLDDTCLTLSRAIHTIAPYVAKQLAENGEEGLREVLYGDHRCDNHHINMSLPILLLAASQFQQQHSMAYGIHMGLQQPTSQFTLGR